MLRSSKNKELYMKIFKNTVVTLALCIIGNINTKQVGQKTTTTSIPTTTTTQVRTSSKANSSQAQSQQPLLQPGTFRDLFTEIRNMKTADVFTPNKSQLSDKVVQLAARGQISELEPLENESLMETLIVLHVLGTIVSPQDMYKEKTKEIFEPLITNCEQRVDALVQQQRPDLIEKRDLTNHINEIIKTSNSTKYEDSLWYNISSRGYNFDKIKTILNAIITQANIYSQDMTAIKSILIANLPTNFHTSYYFNQLTQDQRNNITDYIRHYPFNKKLSTLEQPRVTEKNKQMMQGRLEIETALKLNTFIEKSDLDNNDMKKICTEIDFLLRKANLDYEQLGSTNAEKIANANMAIDIVKKEIINKLSELKAKTMLKLADYILLTKQNDKAMIEIGKELNMRATA